MPLRGATDSDRDQVLVWRNHPRVREVSLTAHEIAADEHALWWRLVQANPDRHLLIYHHEAVPSGVVLFAREEPEVAVWSFYLDVDGLAGRDELLRAWVGVERESIAYAFGELGVERIEGEVLADNAAVLALHRRFGFRVAQRYDRDVDGAARPVLRVELRAAQRLGSLPTAVLGRG